MKSQQSLLKKNGLLLTSAEARKGIKMNNKFNEEVGRRIREKLEKRGDISQHRLSHVLNVEQSTVNKYLYGTISLSFEKAVKIADILDMDLNYLAYGESKTPSPLDVDFILKTLKSLYEEIEKHGR